MRDLGWKTCSAAVGASLLSAAACSGASSSAGRPSSPASAAPSASAAPDDPLLARLRGERVALPASPAAIRVSDGAAAKLDEMIADAPAGRRAHVRVFRRCAIDVLVDPPTPSDRRAPAEGARLDGDALSLAFLSGALIDFAAGPHGAGFSFQRPAGAPTCESAGWSRALDGLDERVGACLPACRDEACRSRCWCQRAAEASYIACASASSADEARCAGALTSESALCAAEADSAPLGAEP